MNDFNTEPIVPVDGFASAYFKHYGDDVFDKHDAAQPFAERFMPQYLSELKVIAKECHADGIRYEGGGAEAEVFELFRAEKPLQVVVRMEPGVDSESPQNTSFSDFDESTQSTEKGRVFAEGKRMESGCDEFPLAFNRYPTQLPAYFERIVAFEDRGMHFKVMPKVFITQDLKETGLFDVEIIDEIDREISERIQLSAVSEDEMAGNVSLYLDRDNEWHAIYHDPRGSHSYFPEILDSRDDAETEKLREEIQADAKKLLAGEETDYAKRMAQEPLKSIPMPKRWQETVALESDSVHLSR